MLLLVVMVVVVVVVVVVLYGFKRRTQECRMWHCERRECDDLTRQLNYLDLVRGFAGNLLENEQRDASPPFYPVDERAMAADVVISSGSTW